MAETNSEAKGLPFWRRTFSSLRYRNFRLVWLGSVTEHVGERLEFMAVAWLMMELTGSPYWLGLLAVSRALPGLFFSFAGGVITDRVDRRNLLISTLVGTAFISVALFILVRTGLILPWHLLVSGGLTSALMGFNHPARDAIVPNVTPKEEWMNAIALDTVSVRAGGLFTAPLGGFLIALYGTGPLFGVRAVGSVFAILWLLMASVPATPPDSRKQAPWRSLGEGLKYAVGSSLIMVLLTVFVIRELAFDAAHIFIPFFANDILGAGAVGYGYLSMANSVGGITALFGIASLGNFRYKGWFIVIGGILSGVFLSAFAFSRWLILSIVLLSVATSFLTAFENVARTALQTIIPDEFRGRVMSLRQAIRGFFGPWIGLGLGFTGEHLGVAWATLLFSFLVVACFSLLALLFPSLRKL